MFVIRAVDVWHQMNVDVKSNSAQKPRYERGGREIKKKVEGRGKREESRKERREMGGE